MQIPDDGLIRLFSRSAPFGEQETLRGLGDPSPQKAPLVVRGYRVEVFDMSNAERRAEYEKLMLRLLPLIHAASCVVCKNELQVLQTKTGTGWWRYLEWFEYELRHPGSESASAISTNLEQKEKDEQP